MDNNQKPDLGEFAGYLQSIVQVNAIERITHSLDSELTDSQRVMMDIKAIFDSVATSQNCSQESANNYLRYEDMSKFLDADPPKLLLSDMAESNIDVNLDDVIASMKGYAEDLKKNFVQTPQQLVDTPKKIENIDLEQYALSLDQLSKRLANMKLNKKDDHCNKNPDLETKLSQLCEDVSMFTQMVQAKTSLGERNKSWAEVTTDRDNSMYYDSIINKLLSGINEVSYLLQNKH